MSSQVSTYNEMTIAKSVFVWVMGKTVILDKRHFGELLTSPIFYANNLRWELSLHLKKISEECEACFLVVLQKVDFCECEETVFVVSLLNSEDKPYYSRRISVPNHIDRCQLGLGQFVSFSELTDRLDEFLTDDKIKIRCEIFPKKNMLKNVYSPPDFISFFNNPKLSDVTFFVGKKRLYGHKVILINRSEVFTAMFEHTMKESIENVVYIEDISYDIFVEMMRFIYSGQVNGIQNIAEHLLLAADKYALFDLKFVCGECLCDSLTDDNVVELLSLADRHNIYSLKRKALNYVVSHSPTLINTAKFKNITRLDKDLLFEVIRALALERNRDDRDQLSPGNLHKYINRSLSRTVYAYNSPTYTPNSPTYTPSSPTYTPTSPVHYVSNSPTYSDNGMEENPSNSRKKRRR